MARPLHAVRRTEQRARRAALEARGFAVAPEPMTTLEGGDVVVHTSVARPRAYLGHGFRSSRHSVVALERFLDVPVLPLELRDPTLYHLDMALAVLGSTTFVCEEALTPGSMRDLLRAAGTDAVVRVPPAEARRFALNFVAVGSHVVLARGARLFEQRVRELGYVPHGVALSELQLAGGSAACLVAPVHLLGRVAVSRTAAIRSTAA
jgi:N-dimethylarginine dimethylaminohydrolase